MSEDFPLYYSINDLMAKQLVGFRRPIDEVNTSNVMDMLNAIRHEGRQAIAIVLDAKGMEYFQRLDGVTVPTPVEEGPEGFVGRWFHVPVFTDNKVPVEQSFRAPTQSFIMTGIDGVLSLSEVPKEAVTYQTPLPPVNALPHEVDPFFDQTLIQPVIRGNPLSLKEKLRAVISAEVRAQFHDDKLSFMDSKYDTQHFNIEPLVEGVYHLLFASPEARGVTDLPAIPHTLRVVPNVPHHAQNLTELEAELAYWTARENSATGIASSAEAYKQRLSCEKWIARRRAENVVDSPKL